MSARQFEPNDPWETTPLVCPRCGWTGTFLQGDTEGYESFILTAVCPCGDESDSLFVRYGSIERPAQVPALCTTCHQYVTVEASRPRVRCPTCRRKPQVVAAFVADDGPAEGQAFECPACGAISAVFQECGLWD